MKNIIEELKWRGLLHDMTPEVEEQFLKEPTSAYIGFDPTSDSLHIGSLVPIILLKHLERFGHNPIALVGGATGMIGDPSGKSSERNLLDTETLDRNVEGIKNTLHRFLSKDTEIVNNYDWMSKFSFIDFVRDIGKKITVNYMLSKTSVKNRIEGEGMSFTEFTYQLIQGYDFLHLNREKNCLVQMGGSDQWGNMTTGIELINKITGNKAHALTCPLLTKADGSKFGKSEAGENIWLDKSKTSPYKFFQFWLNSSDSDAERFIKIFTFLTKEEIDSILEEHNLDKGRQFLQKTLAKELTCMVHGVEEFELAVKASNALFGDVKLSDLNKETLLDVFDGLKKVEVTKDFMDKDIVDFLVDTKFLPSKREARQALKDNSVSINKSKIKEGHVLSNEDLMDNLIVVQRGKRNFCLIEIL